MTSASSNDEPVVERPLMTSTSSNYESVVEHPLYKTVNERLVDLADVHTSSRVVDLGGGTGSIAQIVLERVPTASVWLVDPDDDMLADARSRLGDRVRIERGVAEDLVELVEPATIDAVLLGNCVHLIDDIPSAFSAIASVLASDGTVAFNSAFYAGADVADERHLYWDVLVEARRQLRRKGIALPARAGRSLAKRPLTPEHYAEAAAAAGLETTVLDVQEVLLDVAILLDIVSAPVFAEGALPGLPVAESTAALRHAVEGTVARTGVAGVRRNWLTIVATKRSRSRSKGAEHER